MIITKTPLRISLFGGSTDYESFYTKHGSFLIGSTINKHVYISIRYRSKVLSNESIITYSKMNIVKNWDEIQNPLIRATLKHTCLDKNIDLNSFSDMPARTGLGGSSSYCIGLLKGIRILQGIDINKKELAKDAISIERLVLNEPGGIQDQIWAAYGGLNSIEIDKNGNWAVKPLPITDEFKHALKCSMLLIYTNEQRNQNDIAKSHEEKDKKDILDLSKHAYSYFLNENIEKIGKSLYESWKMKMNISNIISSCKINDMINRVMELGAYGAKLLGAGGCGFILVIANELIILKIKEEFKLNVMDFDFDLNGSNLIFKNE